MELIDQLQSIAGRIHKQKDNIQTEEATKNAFVMPFIIALGYDVFNPTEVVPEFTCDVGTKKGEKVDYAIMRDGKAIILIEVKTCGKDLDDADFSQLVRYFHLTEARIAILTNGIVYRFFTDLDTANKMDAKPYLELNLLEIKNTVIHEVKKLTKNSFDIDRAVSSASELKYTREIIRFLVHQLEEPSDDFIKIFATQVYSGRVTQSVKETFGKLIKKAFSQFINDKIDERLKSAMTTNEGQPETVGEMVQANESESKIVTTEEEIEGFHIVKSIVRQFVDPERIHYRDTISYFGILLDDNNRKPICRLHFNRAQKYIGLFDQNKAEERVPISTLNEIFALSDRLQSTISLYENC